MSAMKAILTAGGITLAMLLAVAAFNFNVDPMCYYHCDKIDLDKRTRNHFYQVGQKILAHPKAEIVILGSSRGQTTPLKWIEKRTGRQVLNLSMGASELSAKLAFLNIALEKLKLKKVIWYADYFELITEVADTKIKHTPALRAYLEEDFGKQGLSAKLGDLVELIDHNTLEAAYYTLRNVAAYEIDQGSGWHLDDKFCESRDYPGEKSLHELEKENGITYDTYTRRVLKLDQEPQALEKLIKKFETLSRQNIDILVIIPPYNPGFSERLATELPEVSKRHRDWVEKLRAIKIPRVKVLDYFAGLPQDDRSPRYWNDGVHFTCKGAVDMLQAAF